MSTNIDRAAELLWLPEPHLSGSECDDQARELAQALADATPPLLMPDPPEPQVVPTGMEDCVYLSWRGDPVDVEQSARITELFAPGESFPILSLDANQARSLGLRLLAAANHAERNHS